MKGKELDAFLKRFAEKKHPSFSDIFETSVTEKRESAKVDTELELHYGDVCNKLRLPLKGGENNEALSRGLNGTESHPCTRSHNNEPTSTRTNLF